ncbi:hypothetical protein K488DRAFT_20717, partial [Vararia minispora EC-137]
PSIDQRSGQQFESTPTTASCCTPDVVVVHLQTAVTISNFHGIYRGENINTFNPDYAVTPDGSLLSDVYVSRLRQSAQSVLMFGAYTIFFLWNSIAAVGFVFRTKAKDKTIFYILLASQISALLPWILLIASVFSQGTSCEVYASCIILVARLTPSYRILRATVSFLSAATSLCGFQLTGVFGLKAYRCLFNSRFVFVGLSCFQMGHIGLVVTELVQLRAIRGIVGACGDSFVLYRLFPINLVLTFLEDIFIAGCFLFTVWRTSRLLAAQGRLSFRESLRESA